MKPSPALRVRRRCFLRAGILTAGAAMTVFSRRPGFGAQPPQTNPFAYDVSRHSRVDPALVHFSLVQQFRGPAGARRLAVGPDQCLYIAAGTSVHLYDAQGRPLGLKSLNAEAHAVAMAGDGSLYVGLRDRVAVFAPNASRAVVWASPGERTWISGVAAGKNDVFAADSGNRVVLRYDRSGKLVGRIGGRDTERNVPGLVLPSPFLDVELHPDGLLRVNNPGRHRVEAYTVEGDLEVVWGKPTAAIEGFCGCCNPVSLAILPGGDIVTSEKGLPRVKVYSVHGKFQSVVAGPGSFPENARIGAGGIAPNGMRASLDAAADARGRVYVLDTATALIHVFARKPEAAFGRRHAG
ncbi:MAG: hypothetical protein JXQ71_15525 [Verrucomicrobia bacterium]|nr:hypothetical protein [Verrucomicrobiota bacterium]